MEAEDDLDDNRSYVWFQTGGKGAVSLFGVSDAENARYIIQKLVKVFPEAADALRPEKKGAA